MRHAAMAELRSAFCSNFDFIELNVLVVRLHSTYSILLRLYARYLCMV